MPRPTSPGWLRDYFPICRVDSNRPVIANLGAPALADDDYFVTDTDMKVGAYTLAHTAASDGLPRNLIVTVTKDTENDTMGTLAVVGTDYNGDALTETITPNNGDTSSGLTYSTKAFKSITSITGAGWVVGSGTNIDNIKIGFSNLIGLPNPIAATDQVLAVWLGGTDVAPVVTAGVLGLSTVNASSGTYDGSKKLKVLYLPDDVQVFTQTGAKTLISAFIPAYYAVVEDFLFVPERPFRGTSGSLTFNLTDGTNTIAALALTQAAQDVMGVRSSAATVADAYKTLVDASALTVARAAGGTAFDDGAGTFYVKLRQRPQQA